MANVNLVTMLLMFMTYTTAKQLEHGKQHALRASTQGRIYFDEAECMKSHPLDDDAAFASDFFDVEEDAQGQGGTDRFGCESSLPGDKGCTMYDKFQMKCIKCQKKKKDSTPCEAAKFWDYNTMACVDSKPEYPLEGFTCKVVGEVKMAWDFVSETCVEEGTETQACARTVGGWVYNTDQKKCKKRSCNSGSGPGCYDTCICGRGGKKVPTDFGDLTSHNEVCSKGQHCCGAKSAGSKLCQVKDDSEPQGFKSFIWSCIPESSKASAWRKKYEAAENA